MSDYSKEREHLIERFAALCEQDDWILAAFVGGSIATKTADEYSDLDLYAIVGSDAYHQLLSAYREFVERWATPLFLEHFDGFGFDMLVFILDNGIPGELALAKRDRFLHIHGGPYQVLVDKTGLLNGVTFPWQRPTEEEQVELLRQHLNWFWRDLSLFSVAMARRQRWTAYGYLESMRRRCVNLIRLDRDFESWADGYEKLERVVRARDLAPLEGSFCRPDLRAMAKAAKRLITCYSGLGPRLARRHGIHYPRSLQEVILSVAAPVLSESNDPD